MKTSYLVIISLLAFHLCFGQTVKVSCTEKEKKSEESKDSILIRTCFIKNFKFISTLYPDYAGRYVYSEYEVYIRSGKQYIQTPNSRVFNSYQSSLVAIINKRIQEDFGKFSSDSSTKECFVGIDSIQKYDMDDFDISFEGNNIWFHVNWGLSGACRVVDGTSIFFNLTEIKKYLR
jgi:hypothetical protein